MLVTTENNKEHIARYLEKFARAVRDDKFIINSTWLQDIYSQSNIESKLTITFFDRSGMRGEEP